MVNFFFHFLLEIIVILLLHFLENPFWGLGFFYLMLALNIAYSSFFDTLGNMVSYADFKSLNAKQRKEYVFLRIKYRLLNPVNLFFLAIITYILHRKFGFMYLWALFPVWLFFRLFIAVLIIVTVIEILTNIFLYRK